MTIADSERFWIFATMMYMTKASRPINPLATSYLKSAKRSVRVRVAGDRRNIDLYDLMFAFGRNLLFFQKIESHLAEVEAKLRFERDLDVDNIVDDNFMAYPLGRKIKTIKQISKDEFYDQSAWRDVVEARNALAHAFFASHTDALHSAEHKRSLVAALEQSLVSVVLPRLQLLNERLADYPEEQNSPEQVSFWSIEADSHKRSMYNVNLSEIGDILALTAICHFEAERIETYLTVLKDIQDFVQAVAPARNSTLGKAVRALEQVVGEEERADTPGKVIRDLRNHLSHAYLVTAPERYNTKSGREQCIDELCLWLFERFGVYVGMLPEVVQKVRDLFVDSLSPELTAQIEQNQLWLKDRLEVQIV